jgi:hypothetical protein
MAALAASAGDLLMLGVAHGDRTFAGEGGRHIFLWVGGLLGVASIPIYFVGYTAATRLLAPSLFCRRLVAVGAALVALFGALTHGLTALDIHAALAAGRGVRPPAEAFADLSSPLAVCALISAFGAVIASISLASAGARCNRRDVMLGAVLNPVVWTIVLSIAATLSELLRAYLAPSAPNLAHFLFFIVLARAAARNARAG